jgi:hypothetical protein
MLSQPNFMATPVVLIVLFLFVIPTRGIAQQRGEGEQEKAFVQAQYRFDPGKSLHSRVYPAAASVRRIFEEADMSPVEHELTTNERAIVDAAINMLPPLHKKVLKERLRSLNFLDSMPNTALTSRVNPQDQYQLFDITIRAATLHQTISEWLTEKERSCFDTVGSDLRVTINAGSQPALFYILLHESTHVLDASLEITPQDKSGTVLSGTFIKGIWKERSEISKAYSDTLLEQTRFRRGGRVVPASNATDVYEALKRTPFTSLYSLSSWHEDLAEFVTIYHLTQKAGYPFRISVSQGEQQILAYEPMNSPIVRRRARLMKRFYEK